MKLDEVSADVAEQLEQQAELGVHIENVDNVPEEGPSYGGVWHRIYNVTAVFADLKRSTQLNSESSRQGAAYAYTYFIRGMTVILNLFGARYIDIQGDGIFGLFSNANSIFDAIACAETMRTQTERKVAGRFNRDVSTDWQLEAGIGIDRGTLLVRRLGLRGTKQNEVWAGKPVNVAAKLSSLAPGNHVAVPDRVYKLYENASKLRKRALLWSCGCDGSSGDGAGLDIPAGCTTALWKPKFTNATYSLDFDRYYLLSSPWCEIHGAEFCEAILRNRRP